MIDKKSLSKEEKIGKAKKLMKQMQEDLELTVEDLKMVSGNCGQSDRTVWGLDN